MGSCERGTADGNAARKRKSGEEERMSRLAGAGGAAECALMNAQPNAEGGEWLCGNFLQNHGCSLQAKMWFNQDVRLSPDRSISLGLYAKTTVSPR